MARKLTAAEQRLLDGFATAREGCVYAYSAPECRAAWKLADRGLVAVEVVTAAGGRTLRTHWGRETRYQGYTSQALRLRLVPAAQVAR